MKGKWLPGFQPFKENPLENKKNLKEWAGTIGKLSLIALAAAVGFVFVAAAFSTFGLWAVWGTGAVLGLSVAKFTRDLIEGYEEKRQPLASTV